MRNAYDGPWSISGTVEALSADSLRIAIAGRDTLWIPRWSVFAIEARRGEQLRNQIVGATAVIGLGAGAVASLVMCWKGRITCGSGGQNGDSAEDPDPYYLRSDFLLIAAGGLTGALLGWAIAPPPQWRMAVWPRFDAGAAPGRGRGFAVGLRYSF